MSRSCVVKFVEPRVFAISEAWWPNGEKEVCSEDDAWTRAAHLLALGIMGVQIEGASIVVVRILDAKTEEVLLAVDVNELIFEGPWAESFSLIDGKSSRVGSGMSTSSTSRIGKANANKLAN